MAGEQTFAVRCEEPVVTRRLGGVSVDLERIYTLRNISFRTWRLRA
jgi:hypothetical protein